VVTSGAAEAFVGGESAAAIADAEETVAAEARGGWARAGGERLPGELDTAPRISIAECPAGLLRELGRARSSTHRRRLR